jgi:hypothetical protein
MQKLIFAGLLVCVCVSGIAFGWHLADDSRRAKEEAAAAAWATNSSDTLATLEAQNKWFHDHYRLGAQK